MVSSKQQFACGRTGCREGLQSEIQCKVPCCGSLRLFDAVLALVTLLAVAVDRRKPLQDAASQTGTSPKGFVDVTRPQDAAIVLKVSQ